MGVVLNKGATTWLNIIKVRREKTLKKSWTYIIPILMNPSETTVIFYLRTRVRMVLENQYTKYNQNISGWYTQNIHLKVIEMSIMNKYFSS